MYNRKERSAHACPRCSVLPLAFWQKLPLGAFINSPLPFLFLTFLFDVYPSSFWEKKLAYCWILFCAGMHSVWDHVCEWEKGSAHGQEPLLWWGELFHHPTGGGKGLVGSIKSIPFMSLNVSQFTSSGGLHLLPPSLFFWTPFSPDDSDSVTVT